MRTHHILMTALVIFSSLSLYGQSWLPVSENQIPTRGKRDIVPTTCQLYHIDDVQLRQVLWAAPQEHAENVQDSPSELVVGLADGTADIFRIVRYDMMEAPLAAAYQGIRTFRGVSVSNPYRKIRADWTTEGFRAVISDETGKTYIDPYQRNDHTHVVAYKAKDFTSPRAFSCGVEGEQIASTYNNSRVVGDCVFRTYRLAVAATGEYSNFFGATSPSQSALVLSQVVTAINRVNDVYEADLSVRFVLVGNNTSIFYYDPGTDPYTSSDACAQLGMNQTTLTNVIGSANYDLGHVFSVGSGGCAGLGVLCSNGNKARGATGLNPPTGDPFYIDYVAHEMGHQLGGNHTQNQTCNRVTTAAYEPGSASTIMGYAGICAPNVQNNSDDYFHTHSLMEMTTVITGTSCEETLEFDNEAPVVSEVPNYTIPISTPFVLTAIAEDPDNDVMTYCWEQYDLEFTSTEPPTSNDPDGPLFRSFDPSTSPSRYFPAINYIVSNGTSPFEFLPSVSRPMNFRMTVRDFHDMGGCTDEDNVTVTATNTSGPFLVTSQGTPTAWTELQDVTLTWNVANTTASPVSCAYVDIYLSYDGGYTYPVLWAEDELNDGTVTLAVPIGTTTQGRFMVRGSDNIFFDINNANITINAGAPNFTLELSPDLIEECNDGTVSTTVLVGQFMGFTQPVSLFASNLPPGATANFSPQLVPPGSSSTLTISGLGMLFGNYEIAVQGTSTTGNKVVNLVIDLLVPPEDQVQLESPANNATNVPMTPNLTWEDLAGVAEYFVDVAYDAAFNNIAFSGSSLTTSLHVDQPLIPQLTYYWRVRPANDCGEGTWSEAYSFMTTNCVLIYAEDLPINIPGSGTPTITSTLNVGIDLIATDVDIIDLEGTHSYMDDLRFTLKSPTNTSRIIWDRPCEHQDDFNINLDDEAANMDWPCPPTDGLTYKPNNTLSFFDGIESQGNWVLEVRDLINQDGGWLHKWGIKICGNLGCQLNVYQTGTSGVGTLNNAYSCAQSGDTIRLSGLLSGLTVQVGATPISINKNVVIKSENPNITVSSTAGRVFEVAPGAQVGFEGFTILSGNGASGTGIHNQGSIWLKNMQVHKQGGSPVASLIENVNSGVFRVVGSVEVDQ